LLVKPVKAAIAYMPTASFELPYEGAKEMLLVDEVDDRDYVTGLFEAMYAELPAPKPKKTKSANSRLQTAARKIAISNKTKNAYTGAACSWVYAFFLCVQEGENREVMLLSES
jgi:hypothetical protein